MNKSIWGAVLLCAAVSLSAKVLTFDNFERNGAPVLIPQVREYRADDGAFKLPKVLTVALPAGEELIAEQLDAELKRFGVKAALGDDDVNCRFALSDKDVPENGQGYTLAVDGKGIVVRSRSKAGLFYGAQTLRNMLRNAATPELKACSITDWPEFELRSYTFTIRYMPPENLPKLKRALDALASLKINAIFFEIGESFPLAGNPLSLRKNAFTEEQLLDIADYCHKRHIDIIPTLQVLSHAAWMTFHPDWEKMRENEPPTFWNNQPCIQNQEARQLTEDMIAAHIKLLKPKMFFIMMDEIGHGPFHTCPKCKDKDPDALLADYMKFVKGIFNKHGVTPIVAHDSFVSKRRWPYGDKFREALGREIPVRWWSYRDVLPEDQLVPFKGWPLIGNAVCGKPLNVYNMAKLIRSYGGFGCNMTYWYYSTGGTLALIERETPDSLGGVVSGAEYLWNLRDVHYSQLGYDACFEMMRRMHPELLTMPVRPGSAAPVALEQLANAELSASGKFPRFVSDAETAELKAALGKLPERFRLMTSPGGKYYGLRVSAEKQGRQNIAINVFKRKVKQFSLLLTASRPRNGEQYHGYHYGNKRFDHNPAAYLTIVYADGEKVKLPLRYRQELTDWNRPFGGFNMRFAVRGVDADKNYYSFGICDIKNPHQEKAVKTLMFSAAHLDGISPVLLAVSAWGIDRPYRDPVKPVDPAEVAKHSGVGPDTPPPMRIVADFENGMGVVSVSAPAAVKKVMKVGIVDDPTSPSRSKVLKITVPPGKYLGDTRDEKYIRISVDLPYKVPKSARSLAVDYKMGFAKDAGFSHASDYLLVADLVNPVGKPYRVYHLSVDPDGGWGSACNPLDARNVHERTMKKVTMTNSRRISFFFTAIDRPLEIRVDNIGDTVGEISPVMLWKEGGEAEPI